MFGGFSPQKDKVRVTVRGAVKTAIAVTMGLYSRLIFPRLLELSMSSASITAYRQALLKDVSGKVLEIGFGTGLNLPHYSDSVTSLTTVDPNEGMSAIANKRIAASPIEVTVKVLSGEILPFEDASFDAVVCTWTLCSIPNATQALQECHRVLKPGGQFFFIEHGLSDEAQIQAWQNRLTPIQRVVADGCHLNRCIDELVGNLFEIVRLEKFYAPTLPKVMGYFYRGVGVKSAV
jgi:SAM-dependent methyltransferase